MNRKPKFRIVVSGPFMELDTQLTGKRALNQTLKPVRAVHIAGLEKLYGTPKNQFWKSRKSINAKYVDFVGLGRTLKQTVSIHHLA